MIRLRPIVATLGFAAIAALCAFSPTRAPLGNVQPSVLKTPGPGPTCGPPVVLRGGNPTHPCPV